MGVRNQLGDSLVTDWADLAPLDVVRVVVSERIQDRFTTPTLLVRIRSIDRNAAAPQSHRDYGLLLTLISDRENADAAADQLDPILVAVLDYLDPRYTHEPATAVMYGNRLAYDIPITVIASKE